VTKRTLGPSAAVRIRVMKRDRFRCTYCGTPGTDAELEVDHIIAFARGGSHHMSNLTTACRRCNQSKGDRDAPRSGGAIGSTRKGYELPPAPRTEYFPSIQCGLLRVEVDFSQHAVTLHVPDGECTDMRGAVRYAKELDQDVRRINTIAGGRRDNTSYLKEGDRWIAIVSEDSAISAPANECFA
jgi:hypothetical protein